MRLSSWCFRLCAALLLSIVYIAPASAEYQVGRARTDITGPALDVQMWGFVKESQIANGIHFRQWSRAYVIRDTESGKRLAFVSADIGSITHAIRLSVVENLRERFGETYSLENTILSATHTHAAPGGFWIYGAGTPLGEKFYQQYFDVIVSGIVDSIAEAHNDLRSAKIFVNQGDVENAGANRSTAAYDANPQAERARYDSNTDKQMMLLKFTSDGKNLGSINWFAVHPTAMTYNNRLISGDQKGHASYLLESKFGGRDMDFIAAFAQSNCGDVTPNLNLNNTGPGENEFETARIIAQRQVEVATELFNGAQEELSGAVDYRQIFVDFRYHAVSKQFSGVEGSRTCPSAYGYSFAAGSTEDGGAMPMFREGMRKRNVLLDVLARQLFTAYDPSEECRECHGNKAILFATGETQPYPSYTQVVPMTLARVGQLAIVAVPAEFTTMAGRRLRETVARVLGDSIKHVVLAGYSNDYTGYVTTKEEYDIQHYEGGHTIYGPWTLACYQQEFARMAKAMRDQLPVERGPMPRDIRGQVPSKDLSTGDAPGGDPGTFVKPPKESYRRGDVVEVTFQSSNPRDSYPQLGSYLHVERQVDGQWNPVASDNDWATKCRWTMTADDSNRMELRVIWEIPTATEAGIYRIGHSGKIINVSGNRKSYSGYTPSFRVE